MNKGAKEPPKWGSRRCYSQFTHALLSASSLTPSFNHAKSPVVAVKSLYLFQFSLFQTFWKCFFSMGFTGAFPNFSKFLQFLQVHVPVSSMVLLLHSPHLHHFCPSFSPQPPSVDSKASSQLPGSEFSEFQAMLAQMQAFPEVEVHGMAIDWRNLFHYGI